jgi:sigma-E factor negative regulatory protein RseA
MNDTPQSDANHESSRRADLSALMDGQSPGGEMQRCSDAWRTDADTRATWHAYHLIGDVLRSDELAGSATRDAALLAVLRRRLADEPTVLAPAAVAAPPRAMVRRRAWLKSGAVAAGFIAVAGTLVVSRMSAPEPAVPALLAVNPPALLAGNPPSLLPGNPQPSSNLQLVGAQASTAQALVLDGQLIRDAQLDAYLRAHRDMRGSAAAAVPGGAMRSVETIVPQR